MRNLFEYGGEQQLKIINQYFDKMPKIQNITEISNYFNKHANNLFSIREEREEIPNWVLDKKDYIQKSETMICVELVCEIIKMLKIPAEAMIQGFKVETKTELSGSLDELDESTLINSAFLAYKNFAELKFTIKELFQKRNLNEDILLYQLTRKLPKQTINQDIENN